MMFINFLIVRDLISIFAVSLPRRMNLEYDSLHGCLSCSDHDSGDLNTRTRERNWIPHFRISRPGDAMRHNNLQHKFPCFSV